MQGLGFAWALQPWIERLYAEPERRREALERHAEYFNTQPHAASLIVGLVCKLEERAAAAPEGERLAAYARLRAVKNAMGAALAGLGDAFFWTALRPAAAACGLFVGMISLRAGYEHAGLWAALVYVAAYNVPALWLRWRGLALGYEWGEELPARLKTFDPQRWVRRIRVLGTTVAVALFALAAAQMGGGQRMLGALILAGFWIIYRIAPHRVNAMRIYGGSCALGWLAAVVGWL
mgnify:CR=1 FL=1